MLGRAACANRHSGFSARSTLGQGQLLPVGVLIAHRVSRPSRAAARTPRPRAIESKSFRKGCGYPADAVGEKGTLSTLIKDEESRYTALRDLVRKVLPAERFWVVTSTHKGLRRPASPTASLAWVLFRWRENANVTPKLPGWRLIEMVAVRSSQSRPPIVRFICQITVEAIDA
jgi:hypothetical protein